MSISLINYDVYKNQASPTMDIIIPSKHNTLINASITGTMYPLFHMFYYCEPIQSMNQEVCVFMDTLQHEEGLR